MFKSKLGIIQGGIGSWLLSIMSLHCPLRTLQHLEGMALDDLEVSSLVYVADITQLALMFEFMVIFFATLED